MGNHKATKCRFKDATVSIVRSQATSCGLAAQSSTKPPSHLAPSLIQPHVETAPADLPTEYPLFTVSSGKTKPLLVTITVDGADMQMEVDTGAALSVISNSVYQDHWANREAPAFQPTETSLTTYTGHKVSILGTISVPVVYKDQSEELTLYVVQGEGPSLLGRDWLRHLTSLSVPPTWHEVVESHADLFRDELGLVQGVTAKIHIDPQATPKFYRPRTVAYAKRAKIEQELARLERDKVIERVQFSDWAAPIVPVTKPDGSIRICGDYKLTVNGAAKLKSHPLPRIDDILASLAGGKSFTKLNLAHAYNQIPLDEEAKKYVVINTHKGLYKYNHLPFGIASAPSMFQRVIESILQDIPNVCVYLDDILVTGKTDEEHLHTLEEVLARLQAAGIRLHRNKCTFMAAVIEYLGYVISAGGIRPTNRKVNALKAAPAPSNVSQLKSFLGVVNYYSKFLPNLSSTLSPLYRLLQKRQAWCWGPEQQQAFETAKQQLSSWCTMILRNH